MWADLLSPFVAQFGVNMFTTLPLELFVCREVLEMYFWPPAPGQPPTFNYTRHVTITTCLILASLTGTLIITLALSIQHTDATENCPNAQSH